jgi:hypothetical protein
MADATVPQPEATTPPLSEGQRVIDTFIAPSKTFTDIRRSASWWLPFVIGCLVTWGLAYAIQSKITWEKAYDNVLKQSPKQMERMEQAPADQQAKTRAIAANFTKYVFWAAPVVGLIIVVVMAAVLMATINFGFGGKAKFGQMFALFYYSFLPISIKAILGIVTIFAGLDPDSFNMNNYVGTNLGYYLPPDFSKPLMALATSIDIFAIWMLVLLTIGCAIIGNIKKGQAAIAVWGWWALLTAFGVVTAMFK